MRGLRRSETLNNPIVIGSIILLAAAIGVILSYNANRGLPFVPTYEITAQVPDAAELIEGSSEVRVGGARVGLIKKIEPVPAKDSPTGRAIAELTLALDQDQAELPADTRVQVRPRSILGAKYVDVTKGTSERTIEPGGVLPLRQAKPVVELDEAFNVFDAETSRAIRGGVSVLGDAFAGRGLALNETIDNLSRIMAPLTEVMDVLARPSTELSGFLDGAQAATAALAPVAPRLGGLLDDASTTFDALDDDALDRTLAELPPTLGQGTDALASIRPVLRDAAAAARELRPGTRLLEPASRSLAGALRAGTPILRRTPAQLAAPLGTTLQALGRLARTRASSGAVARLITTVQSLGTTLDTLLPAQLQCNVGGLWARNVPSILSNGDADGGVLATGLLLETLQQAQAAHPVSSLNANPVPNNDATECETGNEDYKPGGFVGNPDGKQRNATQETAPPQAATARARAAGLLTEAGR